MTHETQETPSPQDPPPAPTPDETGQVSPPEAPEVTTRAERVAGHGQAPDGPLIAGLVVLALSGLLLVLYAVITSRGRPLARVPLSAGDNLGTSPNPLPPLGG